MAVQYIINIRTRFVFSALLALCEGNPPVTGGFPSQRPVTHDEYGRNKATSNHYVFNTKLNATGSGTYLKDVL